MAEIEELPGTNGVPRLEPMSIGMILDKAINLYAKNFLLFYGIMIIPQALSYLLQLSITPLLGRNPTLWITGYSLFSTIFGLLTLAVATGAVTVAISRRYLAQEITITRAYRVTLPRLGTILLAWIVAYLLIFLGFFVVMIAGGLVFALAALVLSRVPAALIALGVLVFPGILVMGILFAISYSLITPAIMLEHLSARKSRERSERLIRGYRWQAVALTLIYLAVLFILYYGSFFLAALISGASPLDSFTGTGFGAVLHRTVGSVVSTIVAPLSPILIVLIYYNQRIREEGFDLSLLAEALANE